MVIAPTRELAHQIHTECNRFAKGYQIMSVQFAGLIATATAAPCDCDSCA